MLDFNGPITGSGPNAVVDGGNGKLYGTTNRKALNDAGALYSIDLSNYQYKKK